MSLPSAPAPARRRTAWVTAVLVAVAMTTGLLAGCTSDAPEPDADAPAAGGESAAPAPTPPPGPAERLGLGAGWGPTPDELDRAARLAGGLRLPDLAGQVIVAEWTGTRAPVALVRSLHLGGVVAFESNVVSAAQVTAVNRTLARQAGRRWPLFLAVDQEGGVVERMRGAATRFPTFMSVGAAADTVLTETAYGASGAELRALGFTVDFAPVADVTSGPGDPTIGSRSASSRPAVVAEQVLAAARGFLGSGVVPVVKHFPGHGSVPADSHLTLPVQQRSRAELERSDLVPFRAAVEAGLPAIMVGHLDVRAIDPRVPSSLSPEVVTGLLREDLGFEGLVVSDSLSMTGVTRGRDPGRIAVQAMRAGNDVLLMPRSPAVARAALVRAVRAGHLSRRRLEQAAARQIALLTHLRRSTTTGGESRPGSGRSASRRLSLAAVTSVSGACSGRLLGDVVHPYGDPGAVAGFTVAAQAAGLTVLQRQAPPRDLTTAAARPDRRRKEKPRQYRMRVKAWERAEARRERLLSEWEAREAARLARGTAVGFSGYRDAPVDGSIAVATDTPWVLAAVDAPVRIATYGDTPGAMGALVDVLLGRAEARGRLPVRVPGVPRTGC